jgi:hypothetical protein
LFIVPGVTPSPLALALTCGIVIPAEDVVLAFAFALGLALLLALLLVFVAGIFCSLYCIFIVIFQIYSALFGAQLTSFPVFF